MDDSVDSIRSRTLMFGKNCDGHALSALSAVVHCAFSLVFIHFCDHNLDSPSTTAGMSKNDAYLLIADLNSLSKMSWYQASTCKRLALMGCETMTDVVYYDVQQWYVDINTVKLTRIVWTDIGTIP